MVLYNIFFGDSQVINFTEKQLNMRVTLSQKYEEKVKMLLYL